MNYSDLKAIRLKKKKTFNIEDTWPCIVMTLYIFYNFFRKVLHSYTYNIFITHYKLKVVYDSNLDPQLKLLFYPPITTNNNLPLRIIVKMLWTYIFFCLIIDLMAILYLLDFFFFPLYVLGSNATDTNYFITFLQTINVANSY